MVWNVLNRTLAALGARGAERMKISEAIRWCAAIERLVSEVYERFAESMPEPPLGDLWRDLAGDEKIHESRLDEIARFPLGNEENAYFTRERFEALREKVLGHLRREEHTIDGTLAAALDLETLEIENVYQRLFALTTRDSRMAGTLRAALGEVGRHQQKIVAAIREHSKDAELRARAEQMHEQLLRHPTR
jgi:rubrerythrin